MKRYDSEAKFEKIQRKNKPDKGYKPKKHKKRPRVKSPWKR